MTDFWPGPGGRFRLPTTESGARFCVLIGLFGMRAAAAVSIALSATGGLAVSPHRPLYLLAGALAVGDCVVHCLRILHTGRAPGPAWLISGTVIAAGVLLAAPLILPWSGHRGAWLDWPPQFALLIGFNAAVIARTRRGCAVVPLLLAVTFVTVSVPPSPGYLATTATTVLTLLGVPFVTRTVTEGLLDLGREADQAHTAAADAARESVRARHRLLLRDAAGLLRMLSSDSMTPAVRALLDEQVAAEIGRIRNLLSDTPADVRVGSLVAVIVKACGPYADLPLELSLDLAAGVDLTDGMAAAAADTIAHALEDVRRYAAPQLVVVHASASGDGAWELSIRDDGVGIDRSEAWRSCGLATTLAGHNVTLTVRSVPADGTVVLVTAPAAYPGDSGFSDSATTSMLTE